LLEYFYKIAFKISTLATRLNSTLSRNFKAGHGVIAQGLPIISAWKGSTIKVGPKCVLTSHSRATALGVRGPVILRTLAEGAVIDIGADCGLSGTVICAYKSVTIGEGALIGADVMIFDTDFHPADHRARRNAPVNFATDVAEVEIGRNVFIGTRSTICKGVRIGDNAVIAAGSVVTKNVEPNSVYGGVPAKKLRDLTI